jgi:tRNA(Ile)-lysidine synthase
MALFESVRADGLLAPGRPVVVLFSGGRDSTCLLDVVVRIAGRAAVSALHVNYGLRDAAAGDERSCAEVCERLGVPLSVRRPRRPERGNLQAWARDERYGAAVRMAMERGADVAAGHTATDQVETILYRLASSPSRRALLGMPAREGLLVRPLLGFTRAETAEYCRERGLEWREDESNQSDAYARARVRDGLVPALAAVHPGAERNVLALAELLRAEGAVLDSLVDDVLGGRREIELTRLRALAPALQGLVVQRLADQEAPSGLAPGAARRAAEVAALSDRGTVSLDVPGGVRAVVTYGVLRFEARSAPRVSAPDSVRLPVPGRVAFGEHEVRCELAPPTPGPGVLDRAALGSSVLVRSWRAGDRMRPLGLGGSKSLQDLFVARRVPRRERAGVAVIEAAGGEIAWVAGVATSERFKVTETTTEAVHLSVGSPGRP